MLSTQSFSADKVKTHFTVIDNNFWDVLLGVTYSEQQKAMEESSICEYFTYLLAEG